MSSLIPEDLSSPGTHALVIGVSRYPHVSDGTAPTRDGIDSGLEQLTSAVNSASEFAAWVLQEYTCTRAPLRSLRVLLSPSKGEAVHPAIAALLPNDHAATIANVASAIGEFKKASDTYPDNVLLVYIAGHGVQLTKTGAIVLLEDFAGPGQIRALDGAIDVAGIHAGMNHPNTAQTQFWFSDACRQKLETARRFEKLAGAFTLDERKGDAEASPLFLAATTGTEAYARKSGATFFSDALLWALRGGAARGPKGGVANWHISVGALIENLPNRVADLARRAKVQQSTDIAGKIHDAVIQELPGPPKIDVTIDVAPQNAWPYSSGTLKHNATKVIFKNYSNWPFRQRIDAGLYLLSIDSRPPYLSKEELLNLSRPEESERISVEP